MIDVIIFIIFLAIFAVPVSKEIRRLTNLKKTAKWRHINIAENYSDNIGKQGIKNNE